MRTRGMSGGGERLILYVGLAMLAFTNTFLLYRTSGSPPSRAQDGAAADSLRGAEEALKRAEESLKQSTDESLQRLEKHTQSHTQQQAAPASVERPAVPVQAATGGGLWGPGPGGGLLECTTEMRDIITCSMEANRALGCTGVPYWNCLKKHGVKEGTYTRLVEARHGIFLVNLNDMYLGASLLAYGEWSEGEVSLMASFLQEDSVFIDVGANIGAVTIPLAKIASKGLVISYEPQRVVNQILCSNVQLNSLSNVVVRRAGAGSALSHLVVHNANPRTINNFGGLAANSSTGASAKLLLTHDKVPVETIDSLNLARLTLVKVDAQGMEKEVIAGATETIMRCRPIVYLEYEVEDLPLFKMLKALNYKCYHHGPPLYSINNYNRLNVNLFGRAISFNILCVPIEQKALVPESMLRGDLDEKGWMEFYTQPQPAEIPQQRPEASRTPPIRAESAGNPASAKPFGRMWRK